MEEEFDLRPYITLLLNSWKIIVFPTILLAILAFIINLLITTPTYSATAIVAIIASRDSIEIDRTIFENDEKQPLAAFPEIALSDEILNEILLRLNLENEISIFSLRNNLKSVSGADRSLIILNANSDDPDLAAELANVWAEVFVEVANRLYVGQNQEQVVFFEQQLEVAQGDLVIAENTFAEFQSTNQTQIISNTLSVYEKQYTDFLERQIQIARLSDNASLLREQLLEQPSATPNSFADELTYLQLQLQTFNYGINLPIFLQLNGEETISAETRSELIDKINRLLMTLDEQDKQANAYLDELKPEILSLQQAGTEAILEFEQLSTNLEIARQTYNALAYQVAEERIVAEDNSSGFQLASRAVVPNEVNKSRPPLAAAAGAVVGLLLTTTGILVNDWWKRQAPAS